MSAPDFRPERTLSAISRRLLASSFFLRPPIRPLALAAARPAEVRSRIIARSNSANEATICIEMRVIEILVAGRRVSTSTMNRADEPSGALLVALALCNDRGSDQQQDQKVGKLSKQHTELAPPRALADGIWPVMCPPLCHFGFGKTVCPVGPKLGDSRGGIQNVPDL